MAFILSGIVTAIVGGIIALVGFGASSGSISVLVGVVVTLLLAFFVGGYAAGRMARAAPGPGTAS